MAHVRACWDIVLQDGHVYLADFGVSAPAEKRGSQTDWAPRNTFVGTPCWMAPEVVERSTYDQSADIWSFGITLLELAHGHAPFAKFPPFKVILMTINVCPPGDEGCRH
jgi:serine/threonine-protein kinase OSR1/STK39